MGKKMVVRFKVQRHGEKDGDELTPRGEKQVAESSRRYFAGIEFVLGLCSDMYRAFQTNRTALQALGLKSLTTRKDPGFGYLYAENPDAPMIEALKRIQAIVAAGTPETMGLWFAVHPPTRQMSARFRECLFKWVCILASQYDETGLDVLVSSHSPCSETAVLDPSITHRLGLAGIVEYVVEVDTETFETRLLESQVVFQGYPEG